MSSAYKYVQLLRSLEILPLPVLLPILLRHINFNLFTLLTKVFSLEVKVDFTSSTKLKVEHYNFSSTY